MDTNAPEENPYKTQNTMMGALLADGSHRARTIMAEKAVVMIMTLKRPNRSASMPGRIRPKILGWLMMVWGINEECTYEAAFRMGIR
jgi:hypothetical protein